MELYQRKGPDGSLLSPFWYYDIALPDGARSRRSTRKKKRTEAQRVMADALREAEEVARNGPKVPTLRDALLAYAEDLRSRGRRAYDAQKIADKTFAAGVWAGRGVWGLPLALRCDELTEDHIRSLKAARRREGLKAGSISQELSKIRSAIIAAGVRLTGVRWQIEAAPGKTRWLSRDEWQRVYDELDPDARPMGTRWGISTSISDVRRRDREVARDLFVALTMCGGRWNEVAKLTADQVLVGDDGTVRVRLYGWKTGKERLVPAPPVVADTLLRRASEAAAGGSPYLFIPKPPPGRRGPQVPARVNRGVRMIRAAFDRAGVNEAHITDRLGVATIHSLRHTFASWLRQAGLSLSEIQELLGHEDEKMTRRYAHISPHVTVDLASKVLSGIVSQAMERGTVTAQEGTGLQQS